MGACGITHVGVSTGAGSNPTRDRAVRAWVRLDAWWVRFDLANTSIQSNPLTFLLTSNSKQSLNKATFVWRILKNCCKVEFRISNFILKGLHFKFQPFYSLMIQNFKVHSYNANKQTNSAFQKLLGTISKLTAPKLWTSPHVYLLADAFIKNLMRIG